MISHNVIYHHFSVLYVFKIDSMYNYVIICWSVCHAGLLPCVCPPSFGCIVAAAAVWDRVLYIRITDIVSA